ncbi:MAG: MFS transporter [Capsulimonadales bacterium]|nr:MFS transporter [Capsulimonadales bacterium]
MSLSSEVAVSDPPIREPLVRPGDDALMRKVAVRLIPFLFFLYVIAYLDRVNVGFAKLAMAKDLNFSETEYGIGAGIFFIGYFLFEVPSNLLLQRFGARRWIMRIMVSWGLVAMGMLFVNSVPSFYLLRFLLGLAEAGFFPGILLYLTFWFTAKERAKMIAWFMTANAVSFIVGGPLSGWLMTSKFIPGLTGWQQMFLLEGLPAVLMAFVVLAYLPDGPRNASWLTEAEKDRVQERLREERRSAQVRSDPGGEEKGHLTDILRYPSVWVLCGCYFFFVVGMYGISLWLPQLIQRIGNLTPLQTGFLSAVPYLISGTFLVMNGYHSDRTGERPLHIFVPALFGAAGLVGCAFLENPALSLASLSLAASGMWAMLGPFWAMAKQALGQRGAIAVAGGLAMINSVGNLGGFLGPYAIGYVKDATRSFAYGLILLAVSVLIGAVLALVAGRMENRQSPVDVT